MRTRRLVVVSAGLGEPSSSRMLADRLTDATEQALRKLDVEVESSVVELREHAHDVLNAMLTGVPTGNAEEVLGEVARADGLIAVSPVFKASCSGLFKTFFDVLDKDSLTGTPVLLGATGGTPRHSLVLEHALRPMFTYLRAVVVPTAVYAASEDWGAGGTGQDLSQRVDRAAAELADLVAARRAKTTADPFENPVPFEQLVRDVTDF